VQRRSRAIRITIMTSNTHGKMKVPKMVLQSDATKKICLVPQRTFQTRVF